MIKQALDRYATNTAKAWQHDRSQTVGASEVGQCSRKTFWTKNEGDPKYGAARDPEYVDGWGAKIRGTIMENEFWFPAMQSAFGDRLLFAGPAQQTFVSGFISATPDGLITELKEGEHATLPAGTCVTVECKSADPRTNLSEAKAENIYQTHIQMGLIRELMPYQPTHSILSYIDASFWNEVTEFVIPFDQRVYEAGRMRAAMVMTSTDASSLKPEGWIAGGRECEYCPFTKACGIQRRSVPENELAQADPQFIAEMADLSRKLKFAEGAGDLADKQVRELQDEIKERMRAKGLRRIVGDGVSVTWSSVKGRPSYDNKAIREAAEGAGVKVQQFETVGEPTDRLVIKLTAAAVSTTQAAHAA